MDFLADLKHYPAPDALQWAAAARFDGRLNFQRNRRIVNVGLDGGRIIGCDSNNPLLAFSRHLYAQGWVDRLDLTAVDRRAEWLSFEQALVELNILSREELREAYTTHTLDLVCSVMVWPDGVVAATSSKLRSLGEPESEPIDTVFASMEAARRADEVLHIRETLPHDNIRLGAGTTITDAETTTAENRILESFDGSQTVSELYQVVGGCKHSFLCNLERLLEDGVLTLQEVGATPPEPEENRVELIDVLLDSDLDRRLMA